MLSYVSCGFRMDDESVVRPSRSRERLKREVDFFGGAADLPVNQLPTNGDVLRFMRKIEEEDEGKKFIGNIANSAATEIIGVWTRAISDYAGAPIMSHYSVRMRLERLYRKGRKTNSI